MPDPAAIATAAAVIAFAASSRGAPPAGRQLAGSWTLDSFLTDTPKQIAQALRIDTGQPGDRELFDLGGERGGDEGVGGRFGRGGFGRSGRGRRAAEQKNSTRGSLNADDQKRLDELIQWIQVPPLTLTITETGADVTITGASGTAETFSADGRAQKLQLESGTVERTASWEGAELQVRYTIGHGSRLVYRYSIVPASGQLLVKANFEREPDRPGPFEIKLVYDPPPSK